PAAVVSAPDDHFLAGPNRRVTGSAARGSFRTDSRPGVRGGGVPTPGVERNAAVVSPPDDHFCARPDRPVSPSGAPGLNQASSHPGVVHTATRPGGVVRQGTRGAG